MSGIYKDRDTRAVFMRVSLLLAIAAGLGLATPGVAVGQTIAIRGGKVHLEPGKTIDDATILIRNGVVQRVGKNLPIPSGAQVIDAAGKIVTAGLIESSTVLGLIEVSLERSTREGGFGGGKGRDVIRASYRASDGYNPGSVAIPVARLHGVTSAVSTPRGGLVSGTSGWFALSDGLASQVVVRAGLAMYANLGEASLDSAEGARGLALSRLREVLDDARIYSRSKRNWERNQSRPFAAGRLDLEALIPVVQGRTPLVIRAHRSSDILAALGLARDLRLRMIVEGGTEAWMVAKELAAARVGVILNPELNLPNRFEQTRVRDDSAKILADAGVAVAISTIGRHSQVGSLRQLAGMAVANGMTYDQALAAVTSVPAALFGVDRGTIAAGKVADIVVWSGDPFELSTRAKRVLIAGKEQRMQSRQSLLRDRYRRLKK